MCEFNGNSTSNELTEMLFLELQHLQALEENKYRLSRFKHFKILDFYDFFEKTQELIEINSIKIFLQEFDFEYDIKLISKVFRRITKGYNETISYFEFADFFLYNKAYFILGSCYPNREVSPLELNYSINKNHYINTGEKSEIFSRTCKKIKEFEDMKHIEKQSIEVYNEIELIRRVLATKKDFNIRKIFKIFTGKSRIITFKKFMDAIKFLGLEKNKDQALIFFMKYDKDKDGSLNIEDFSTIFRPENEEYRLLLQQHTKFRHKLSSETLKILSNMLNILISNC